MAAWWGEEAPSQSKFLVCLLPHSTAKEIEAGSCMERVGLTELMVGDVFHRDTLGRAQPLSLQGDHCPDP